MTDARSSSPELFTRLTIATYVCPSTPRIHQAAAIAAACIVTACAGSDSAGDTVSVSSPEPTEIATNPLITDPPPASTTTSQTSAADTAPPTSSTTSPATTAPETTTTEPEPECPAPVPNTQTQSAGIVASFDAASFEISEGVAVDKSGNVYVSLAPLGQIVRFAPGSSDYEVFATVPDWDLAPDDYFVSHYGILGLALDEAGHVYAAIDSASNAGVWRFDCRTGSGTRFEGTENMLFANALAFDDTGNLFVTESFSGMEGDIPLGAIWKIGLDGTSEKWIENTTLGGPNQFGLAKPNGANGIAYRGGLLYVNVLQQTSIVTIEVLDDGSPGVIEPYVETDLGFINDGIALDAQGRVYLTDIFTNGVLRIDPDGTIVPIAGGTEAGFDASTSIAFGIGGTELTMYAVNLAGGSVEPGDRPGPALVALDVDTPGMPLP